MNLFGRRPLCLFCCIFLLVLLLHATMYDAQGAQIVFCLVAVLSVLLGVCIKIFRSCRIALITVLLCCFTVLFSFLYSFFTMILPQSRAAEFVGERGAVCYVIAVDRETEYSSCYLVAVENIEGQSVDIQAALICPEDIDLSVQDRLAARFLISEGASLSQQQNSGALLTLELKHPETAYIRHAPPDRGWLEMLFSKSGIRIVSDRIRAEIGNQLLDYLGEENGALAKGFFLGDRSDISASVTRDFRRSGTSHMMAVSGMHISLLLGSIGLLLQVLYVSKKIRCIVISILAFGFLALTGFTLSACRSVLMLYAVYLNYLFYEDHDSVTALFVAVTAILLISPHAVTDLGLWMSFLAALGLLTVYPLCESHIPYPKGKRGIQKIVLRSLRTILLIVIMTVIANLFLLPIYWIFFKEFPLVSVLSNVFLSPLSTLFLVSIPIILLIGAIPLVGGAACAVVGFFSQAILYLIGMFSNIPYATISLRYPFAGWMIAIFTISMVVLLLIPLHRKWLIAMPSVLAGLAFLIGLGWYLSVYRTPELTYYNDAMQNEWFIAEEQNEISICDISCGGWQGYSAIQTAMEESVCTELNTLLLTHYHKGHAVMLDIVSQNWIIRRVVLPAPHDEREAEIAERLWEIGESSGISIQFYEDGGVIPLLDSVRLQACRDGNGEEEAFVLNFAGNEAELTYISPHLTDLEKTEFAEQSMRCAKRVMIGCHAWRKDQDTFLNEDILANMETVIVSYGFEGRYTQWIPQRKPVVFPPSEKAYARSFLFE